MEFYTPPKPVAEAIRIKWLIDDHLSVNVDRDSDMNAILNWMESNGFISEIKEFENKLIRTVMEDMQESEFIIDAEMLERNRTAAEKFADLYIEKKRTENSYTLSESGICRRLKNYSLSIPGAWDIVLQNIQPSDLKSNYDKAFESYAATFQQAECSWCY